MSRGTISVYEDLYLFSGSGGHRHRHTSCLIDHLPVIAWLRQAAQRYGMYPAKANRTVFLLDDVEYQKKFFETFDPEFEKFILWVAQDQTICVDGDVHVPVYRVDDPREQSLSEAKLLPGSWCYGTECPNNNQEAAERPQFGAFRLPMLTGILREWISLRHKALSTTYPSPPIVLYMMRPKLFGANGRHFDENLNRILMKKIEERLMACNRTERLVAYTAKTSDSSDMPVSEQLRLFMAATLVIGPHGGAAAPMIFMGSNIHEQTPCSLRPQVIEFVPGNRSEHVLWRHASFYEFFFGPRWIEYHMIPFTRNSTRTDVFIDIDEFEMALDSVFDGNQRCTTSKS